ncbi:MAG: molybdopterin oxidoreductase family protein, partial [Candidatus Aminicenantales bacterium]
ICPTGALTERAIKYELLPDKSVTTICSLCPLGCEIQVDLIKDRILNSKPLAEGKVNHGQACVKGRFTLKELAYSSRRIFKPLIRKKKKLEEVSWNEALDFVAHKLKAFKGEEIGIIPSSETTLEDSYLLYKFAHKILKTRNVMGVGAQAPLDLYKKLVRKNKLVEDYNFSLEDVSKAKLIFIINEDIATTYPIIWLEILKAVNQGAKLVVASPVEFSWSRFSSIFLNLKPGAEFYLLSFLSKYFLEESNLKPLSGIENFDSFRRFLGKFEAAKVEEVVGLKEEALKETAQLLQVNSPVFLFGPGLSMTNSGQQNFEALWNLVLLTKGKLIPLSLDCNQRGMIEIENHFSSAFSLDQMFFSQLADSKIKALYAVGNIPHFKRRKPEFLVIQDSFLSEEESRADVILPAATFLEREGTLVNTEGRVQKLNKVINPFGEAKPDWWIISQIAQRMGSKDFNYKKAASITKEIKQSIPALAKISYSKLAKEKGVFISSQVNKGQNKFLVSDNLPLPAKTGKKYPYLLLLSYNSDHYRSLVLSQEVKGLARVRDSRW